MLLPASSHKAWALFSLILKPGRRAIQRCGSAWRVGGMVTAWVCGATPAASSSSIIACCASWAKKWAMERATTVPMSGRQARMGSGARRTCSSEPNACASVLAVRSPTWRMPSANRKRASSGVLLASMPARMFSAHLVGCFLPVWVLGSDRSPETVSASPFSFSDDALSAISFIFCKVGMSRR